MVLVAHLYPEIEPYDHGMIDVGDANQIYWETCGHPTGKPAVALHGGPGSGCTPWWRRLFDPHAYRIACFDQRACGRSTPNSGDPTTDLSVNTTHHLIEDIERLREHLGIESWLVLGGSWGSTLALAYAQAHSERVSELVLFSVTTTTRREVEWITRDMGRLFPAEWERFRAGVYDASSDNDLAGAYNRRLAHPDSSVRERAARDWCTWEDTHVRTRPDQPSDLRYDDPAFRICFARLVTHYWSNAAWLSDDQLLRNIDRLAGIRAVLIQGRLDTSSPLDVPWKLAQRWRESELIVVDGAGHSGDALSETVVAATNHFAFISKNTTPAAGTAGSSYIRSTVSQVTIRPARHKDLPALREIERCSGQRYREVGLDHVADDEPPSIELLEGYAAAGRAWVAVEMSGEPVGYILVDRIDGCGHVEQVSVLPDYQGQGLGRALIDQARAWAIESEMSALTLTTFGHIPWNRPLYEHLGFRVLTDADIGPGLRAVREREVAQGLDPKLRVVMRLDIPE